MKRSVFLDGEDYRFFKGDCMSILKDLPTGSVDCVITSPPYWKMREYSISSRMSRYMIGNETTPAEYTERLKNVFSEVRRVLSKTGSLWLNIGDKYLDKDMVGLPWMVALALKQDGWILRNDVIWNKMKGTQSSKDRLRNTHEYLFHFVKSKSYYYDMDSVRIKPVLKPKKLNGRITSATGVSGTKYRIAISESDDLTATEKRNALNALETALDEMRSGKIVDFRMTIRGKQRVYHSDRGSISGRAKELEQKGFFVIKMGAAGYPPSTIWNIVPEDVWRRDNHCAVFPTELLVVPIKATCPKNGTVLDPFMGTGSTVAAAVSMNRRGAGIELSGNYIKTAKSRMVLLDSRGAV